MIAISRRERGETEREPAAIILSEAKDLMPEIASIAKIAGIDDFGLDRAPIVNPGNHQSRQLSEEI